MNSKKLINSEYGLSHQGFGQNQQMEFETVLFDAFLDAKGGKGGGQGNKGSNDSGTTSTNPEITDTYISGEDNVDDILEFNIHIDFYGVLWTDDLKEDFIYAADFLSTLITNDIAPDGYDDITIDASLIDIDGEGGVLGRAGPTYIWSDTLLTSAGIMEFDSADAASYDNAGLWYDIVLHEMIHTLGLGTLWDYRGLVTTEIDTNGTKKPTDDSIAYVYGSELSAHQYSNSEFGTDVVIESDGGSGTAGGHWDDETYGNELMTGYINIDGNYLSEMTYAGLADLGYDIEPDFFA
ncbi:Leishmanolysin [Marinomonas aquimarina]|uniref:Leishmanolysin n=1 Tax=Marinomonas aquimarina TaxID=295068 RepID=A0A1A8THT7_9GAMM|nr:leishmanolysin-related zinc metalloendopeptidase [Marinomonas aquimarina]SBS33157.1 Leishmanolysin [Marinomonas aquimarina]